MLGQALARFSERLFDASGTVLLTEAGLLARYDRLDLVGAWRDGLHASTGRLRSLWMLVPSDRRHDVPMLNGRSVPVVGRHEHAWIPADWLRKGRIAWPPGRADEPDDSFGFFD